MPYSEMDERFIHQIPEPFPNVSQWHPDWRASHFWVAHPKDRLDDVIVLTLAHMPIRNEMDSYQIGRVCGQSIATRHKRPVKGDQDDFRVGPVEVTIEEPLKRVRLQVFESPDVAVALDLRFTGRTQCYGLRRGTMRARDEVVWDQCHMLQSGRVDGTYTLAGKTYEVKDWVGQRDRSWGIRAHHRVPLWIWLAIQLPEGMLGVWHWEYPNGALVYSDGCFAPSDGSTPIPVVNFRHELDFRDEAGRQISYERDGADVQGIAGRVMFTLQGGRQITVEGEGNWLQRYSQTEYVVMEKEAPPPIGGGMFAVTVRTSDGSVGTAIYEVTGQWHHRYFPLPRGRSFPPYGYSPEAEERAR